MQKNPPKIEASVAIGLMAMGIALGQAFAPRGTLRFDAATVKPSPPDEQGGGVRPAPGGRRYVGTNLPLRSYLYVAYQVREEQIAGGPSWVDTEHYDLNAEAAKPDSLENLHIMLQNALKEKFKLQFHFEKQEKQAYVLSADKRGPKNLTLRERAPGADYMFDQASDGPDIFKWSAHCVSLDVLTWHVAAWLDRPAINATGLDGCFDFELRFLRPGARDRQADNGAVLDASGPDMFQALQDQLGLKLEARKAPVETLVIDHAERPSED